MSQVIWKHPGWTEAERPLLPGSPAILAHTWPVQLRYGAIAVLCSFTGSLGNAMLLATLPQIQGHLALTPVEGQWLTGAYVMMNCWTTLLLFKFRIQYGIHLFAYLGLIAYAALALLHLAVGSYPTALIVRAASGFAASPLLTLGFMYMIQTGTKEALLRRVVVSFTLTQTAAPLAYALAPWLVDLAEPGLQYMFEAGMALCALAAVAIFPLPYSERDRVFESADFASLALWIPGLALLVAVLAEGRLQWWTDKPWIGLALAAALLLITAGMIFEYRRKTPLLDIGWLSGGTMLRFVFGALLLRLISGEQSVGAVGFLRAVGMGPDQLAPLYAIVLAAMIVALIVVAAFVTPKTAIPLLITAVAFLLVGSLLDHDVTPQDRPHDFYLSQAFIGFGSALFIGPLFVTGFAKVMKDGMRFALTMIIVFALCQSIGLLLGSAVLGTFEVFREHEYSGVINADVNPTNPVVQQRLTLQNRLFAGALTDPALRVANSRSQLAQSATLNATTRAYSDVFLLTAVLAVSFIVWTVAGAAKSALFARRSAP